VIVIAAREGGGSMTDGHDEVRLDLGSGTG
jgi:hypothetical protein